MGGISTPFALTALLLIFFSLDRAGARDFVPRVSEVKCHTAIAEPEISAEVCELEYGKFVSVAVANHSIPLVLQAVFPKHESAKKRPSWERFWISSGSRRLSENDHLQIHAALQRVGAETVDSEVLTIAEFITGFVEANTEIPEYDSNLARTLKRKRRPSFTLICDALGQTRSATYVANGTELTSSAIVGDPATRCKGRCGTGCYQVLQWNPNQYTQECLSHDVCNRDMGSMMGPCADSFWKAYDGYMNAPDCPNRAY